MKLHTLNEARRRKSYEIFINNELVDEVNFPGDMEMWEIINTLQYGGKYGKKGTIDRDNLQKADFVVI